MFLFTAIAPDVLQRKHKWAQDHRGLLFPHLCYSLFITVSVISYAIKLNDESQGFSWSHTSFLLVLSVSDYRKLSFFSCWQEDAKKILAGL